MRRVSVREVQHHLAAVLAAVERGEAVAVTRRNRHVATLVPAARATGVTAWPDVMLRLRRAFPGGPVSEPVTSDLVIAGREERPF